MKRLYKNSQNKMLCGVCSGIAEYLELDVTVIRVLWAISSYFAGFGIVAYIICAIVMPDKFDTN